MSVAFRQLIWLVFVLLVGAPARGAEAASGLLTNAMDVLSLPGDKANGVEASIRGVVTAAEPGWNGRFFVQDATAGIFVVDSTERQAEPGDYVQVTGTSHPGGYAPVINTTNWVKLGSAPLPEARAVPIERLMAGIEDSQRVELTGIVRAVRPDKSVLVFETVSGGYRLNVRVPPSKDFDPQKLVGARVRARGTAATFFSGQLRHLITVELHVPFPSELILETLETADPFQEALLPLNHLAQYRPKRDLGQRVHIKGVVTYQRPGEELFLQDATSGIQVKSRQLATAVAGEVVEAVGFLDFEHFLPVLQDAVYRKTGEPRQEVVSKPVSIREFQGGYRHADLVTLEGTVLDGTVRRGGSGLGRRAELTLQNQDVLFTVEIPVAGPSGEEVPVPTGSFVEVKGVCLEEIEADGALSSLRMLASGWSDIQILQQPSWWTARRLLVVLATVLSVLLLAVSWIVMVSRKNAVLQVVIREKAKAQQELQEAHDWLEKRVEERTAQLKVEMSARKQEEVEFKATLAERTRLAQELHDTLEQSLTGIGLQLDTAAKLHEKDPAAGSRHLLLARNLMSQSQVELRRSIWDLRCRELEQFDFPNALRMSAQQIAEKAGLKVEVELLGEPRALSEVAEENLLRISQEALTNVLKHAGASEAKVTLEFSLQAVALRVNDNGRGFDPERCPGAREGHFGLLGMSERAKRLEGQLRISSAPGKGTCLEVQIPTEEKA